MSGRQEMFLLIFGAQCFAAGLLIQMHRIRERRRIARMFAGNPDKDGEK